MFGFVCSLNRNFVIFANWFIRYIRLEEANVRFYWVSSGLFCDSDDCVEHGVDGFHGL